MQLVGHCWVYFKFKGIGLLFMLHIIDVYIRHFGVVDQAGDVGLDDGGRDPGQDEHQCIAMLG